ncbi:hypothetical protein PVAP13_4KG377000 [Panicum virgatum]|uniref:60S ribosomal protein L2, mitochondrial n=1 Tax=Panicum virgatum TaxID=38727 RepID=A0A8T0TT50_PANVG|nr:hypothetical protein PVAP13_4KG377000 [Panicum virgatum]
MPRQSAISLVRDRAKVGALKRLTLSSSKTAGRNSAGRITSFHRGGGAKRLQRKVDVKRGTSSMGIVERIEYDPNRSSSIALVRWVQGVHFRGHRIPQEPSIKPQILESTTADVSGRFSLATLSGREYKGKEASSALYSSLGNGVIPSVSSGASLSLPRIALAGAKPAFFAQVRGNEEGKQTFSLSGIQKWATDDALWAHRMKRQAALSWQNDLKKKSLPLTQANRFTSLAAKSIGMSKEPKRKVDCVPVSYILASHQCLPGSKVMNYDSSKPSKSSASSFGSSANQYDIIDLNSKGGKMVRAAGTYAKVVQEPGAHCVLRLPSGAEKTVDSKCRATIGIVSNPSNGTRKLRKAGHSRWLGRRPVVRGVAMNPVDHPHGGGEGRTKGGRPSVSPWGKPTKGGYRSPSVASRKA